MSDLGYDAFISYRRSDGSAVARWLRREIESFRPPKSLGEKYRRKLRLYLDTAYERGTSDFYEHSIKPALLSSRFLIVVATPDAVRRAEGVEDWIDREVNDFAAGPNGGNVVAVRGAGEFDAGLPANLRQRFPNIEIVDLRGAGVFWFLNLPRANRLAHEKLKLIGPLLEIPADEMPRLRQEEEKRQQTRIGTIAGATAGVLIAVAGLSVFALQSRNQAVRALEDSMYAAGSMALQASALDPDDATTGQVRQLLVNRGCDLVDKLRAAGTGEPQIEEVVMCRIERARVHENLKEFAQAGQQLIEAVHLATTRYQNLPRIDAALGLVKARETYAKLLLRRDDPAGAESQFGLLLDEARRLGTAHQDRRDFLRAQGEALGQIGDILASRDEREKAAASYDAAASVVEKMLTDNPRDKRSPDPQTVAWLSRLHRHAAMEVQKLGNDSAAIERYRRALVACGRAPNTPIVEDETAVAQANLFPLELRRGNIAAAEEAKSLALRSVDLVIKSRSASNELRDRAEGIKRWIAARDKPQ